MDNPATIKRAVKPRRFYYDQRQIIAVGKELVYVERTGKILERSRIREVVTTEPGSIVAVESASQLVKDLHDELGHLPGWQYKASPVQRRKYRQHRRKQPTVSLETVVGFFGFTDPNHRVNRYHMPLDPTMFVSRGIRGLVLHDENTSDVMALYQWAVDVRDWCQRNRMKVTTRNGGLAAALLKDPRFYPEPRRKVPKATNARARDHLPGNHYQLCVPERTYHNAYYLDMQAAHHYVASRLTFPDANSLFARGRFRHPPESVVGLEPWIRNDRPAFRRLIETHGMFLLRLHVPHSVVVPGRFPPPYARHAGIRLAYVYSNEIPLLRELGVLIEGIEAAWTSAHVDQGLNRYATWAHGQVAQMDDTTRRWGKPTLLAVYGMLAARPNRIEFGFQRGNGEPGAYFTPHGMLPVQIRRTERELESPIVNVIHRGMIEAEIRTATLRLARELSSQKIKVLAIYADSVIVDSSSQLPLLAPPWVIKTPLSQLTFFNVTSFDSEEETRLPGIPREGVDRMRRIAQIRAMSTAGESWDGWRAELAKLKEN